MATNWHPKEDGITHINIYSKGRTPLGRFLTNFALAPFDHPTDGPFESVEGYWYWLKTGRQHEILRLLHGAEAKTTGKKFDAVEIDGFDDQIKIAIRAKLLAHRGWLSQLIQSELPLTHYYYYGYDSASPKIIDAGYAWITEYIDSIRQKCKEKGWNPTTN